MEYVISKPEVADIDIGFITPNKVYKVVAIKHVIFDNKLNGVFVNKDEYQFDIVVIDDKGYERRMFNTDFLSTREVNMKKILKML